MKLNISKPLPLSKGYNPLASPGPKSPTIAKTGSTSDIAKTGSTSDIAKSASIGDKISSGVGTFLGYLRYPALVAIGFDEYMRSVSSGSGNFEALGNALSKGYTTSVLLPKKRGLQVPGTKDARKMGVAMGAGL